MLYLLLLLPLPNRTDTPLSLCSYNFIDLSGTNALIPELYLQIQREEEEVKNDSKVFARTMTRMKLPLTEMGKTEGGAWQVKNDQEVSFGQDMFDMSIRQCIRGAV